MASFDFAGWLEVDNLSKYHQLVDSELAKVLSTNNTYLKLPLAQLLSQQSKRLRSTLVIAVVLSQQKTVDKAVIKACVAIELLHLASLVHDDILDHGDLRGGQASIKASHGLNQAIIVGDYLFALATEQAAQLDQSISQIITSAYTHMCYGQALELADQFNLGRSQTALIKAIEGKTAALISAATRVGGLCANTKADELTALNKFGLNFGIAFQLIDDLLDLLSSPKIIGKPTGNDIKEGVYTLPLVLTFKSQSLVTNKRMLSRPIASIRQTLISNGSIGKTIKLIESYNRSAATSLAAINGSEHLAKLPMAYWQWAFANQVLPTYRRILSKS